MGFPVNRIRFVYAVGRVVESWKVVCSRGAERRRTGDEVAAAAHVCAADETLQVNILETNAEILEIVE